MTPMIEIHYSDGHKRRIPESAFVAQGESVVPVLDIGFDNLEEGLLLYYLHYEPARPDEKEIDQKRDPRGLVSNLFNDAFAVIIPPEEMDNVDQVYYEGNLQLFRFTPKGQLVNMNKVAAAQHLYGDSSANDNKRIQIAVLFEAMMASYRERAGKHATEDDLKRAVCEDLGVPEEIVAECIAFKNYFDTIQAPPEGFCCPHCGASLAANSQFCPECGSVIEGDGGEATSSASQARQYDVFDDDSDDDSDDDFDSFDFS